jgi:hypothetical protein
MIIIYCCSLKFHPLSRTTCRKCLGLLRRCSVQVARQPLSKGTCAACTEPVEVSEVEASEVVFRNKKTFYFEKVVKMNQTLKFFLDK